MAFGGFAANEDADIDLRLSRMDKGCSGIVADEKGKPIAGAKVRVMTVNFNLDRSFDTQIRLPEFDSQNDPLHLYAVTDASGRFELPRLSRQYWIYVQITAPGCVVIHGSFDPRAGKDSAESFTMFPGVPVRGKIVFKGSGKLPPTTAPVSVDLQSTNPREGVSSTTFNGADWTFTSEGVRAGTYRANIYIREKSLRKYVCAESPSFDAVAGKTAEVTVELVEGIRVRGKITGFKPDEAVEGGVVASPSNKQRVFDLWSELEKGGTFEIYLPSEGEYQLQYYLQGMNNYAPGPKVIVEKGKPVPDVIIERKK